MAHMVCSRNFVSFIHSPTSLQILAGRHSRLRHAHVILPDTAVCTRSLSLGCC